MITQIIRKHFFGVADVTCNWKMKSQTMILEAPKVQKEFLPESPV